MAHFFKQKTAGLLLIIIFVSMIFSCKDRPQKDRLQPEYWEHFIAHAGGAIDGITYTNCLEALDLSYSKGCRLFELDLVLTTDGKIVAKHDPPGITEAEFMSQLISDKYTPLNMKTINRWFRDHPDAILVTDKINNPQRIYDDFSFPDRVIMELFSWKAVDKAIKLGIKPMVSGILIWDNPDIEQILDEKKIEYICMSRYSITGNEDFLRQLKNKGIKIYIFHLELPINEQPAEEYIWNNKMEFCYGMYANDLSLLDSLRRIKKQ